MTFLVLLIALIINYLWLLDFDRFDDDWFFRFRRRAEAWAASLNLSTTLHSALSLLLVYGIPILVLVALLWLANDAAFGLPAMLLHILVLLVVLDRTQPGKLTAEFLERWNAGDLQGSANYLRAELAAAEDTSLEDEEVVAGRFSKLLVYRCFERMFMVYFWYVLAGPVAVVVVYISYQSRDSHRQDQPHQEIEAVTFLIAAMEWIPLRLLALTFSLAGNFVHCFERLKQSFWVFERDFDAPEMLYGCASCALAGMTRVTATSPPGGEGDGCSEEMACEIEALQGLLERSQAIWLALIALVTIFAL